MAATFAYGEDNGTQTGTPTKGTTRDTTRTEVNWKNADDTEGTAYSAAPIQAGTNSFDKWQFGQFSGTYNEISAGLWAHTAGTLLDSASGATLTLNGKVAPSGGYTTPAISTNANLTVDMSSVIAIGSGQAVQFGITGPEAAGKAASTTGNPAYSDWLTTQLAVGAGAAPGDIANTVTLTLQYDEN